MNTRPTLTPPTQSAATNCAGCRKKDGSTSFMKAKLWKIDICAVDIWANSAVSKFMWDCECVWVSAPGRLKSYPSFSWSPRSSFKSVLHLSSSSFFFYLTSSWLGSQAVPRAVPAAPQQRANLNFGGKKKPHDNANLKEFSIKLQQLRWAGRNWVEWIPPHSDLYGRLKWE